jgi:hypothetical protein
MILWYRLVPYSDGTDWYPTCQVKKMHIKEICLKTVQVAENIQFKLRLDPDTIERLNVAAHKFGRDSAQQVVEELIVFYLPTWSAVNDAMRRAVDYQTKRLTASSLAAGQPIPPRDRSDTKILIKTEKKPQRKTG